jgi:hypothetical protein
VNHVTGSSVLAVLASNPTTIERMPAIENFHDLPDMGRMTARLLWDAGLGYLQVVSWPANVPPSS